MRGIAFVLLFLGILAGVAAVLYFAEPAHSLPAFLPGHIAASGRRTKHGVAAAAICVVLLALAGASAAAGRRAVRR